MAEDSSIAEKASVKPRRPSVRYHPVSLVLCKGKGAYSSSWNSPQNYVTPLVNGITQCYLPLDRGDCAAFTPTGQVGTRFIDPVRMKGWVGLVAGYIPKWFTRPQTVTHPGTNRVWRSATTLIEANALPLSQTANHSIGPLYWRPPVWYFCGTLHKSSY